MRNELRRCRPSRPYSSNRPRRERLDINTLLSNPSWSVRSLLPDPSSQESQEVTSDQLHHLLRLSALPQPKSPEEEGELLKTLHSQLHFVRDIQSVETEDVEPLQSIRDETEEGIQEATIGIDSLRGALENEEIKGRNRRPRRKREDVSDMRNGEDWDAFRTARRAVETLGGKYFIVRSGKNEAV